jgi:hypothetical protein
MKDAPFGMINRNNDRKPVNTIATAIDLHGMRLLLFHAAD